MRLLDMQNYGIKVRSYKNTKSSTANLNIFDILAIYGPLGSYLSKFCKTWYLKYPKFAEKINIFQITASVFCIILKSCPDTKSSLPNAPNTQIFGLSGEIKVGSFWPIWPIWPFHGLLKYTDTVLETMANY